MIDVDVLFVMKNSKTNLNEHMLKAKHHAQNSNVINVTNIIDCLECFFAVHTCTK
jgi:hypothetical protein